MLLHHVTLAAQVVAVVATNRQNYQSFFFVQVDEALSWLKQRDIWSRGKFGAFNYSLCDIESCFIQGVEAVDNMFDGTPETCLNENNDSSSPCWRSLPSYDVTDLSITSSVVSASSELLGTDTENSLPIDQNSDLSAAEGEAKS